MCVSVASVAAKYTTDLLVQYVIRTWLLAPGTCAGLTCCMASDGGWVGGCWCEQTRQQHSVHKCELCNAIPSWLFLLWLFQLWLLCPFALQPWQPGNIHTHTHNAGHATNRANAKKGNGGQSFVLSLPALSWTMVTLQPWTHLYLGHVGLGLFLSHCNVCFVPTKVLTGGDNAVALSCEQLCTVLPSASGNLMGRARQKKTLQTFKDPRSPTTSPPTTLAWQYGGMYVCTPVL